jgi:hypothetical protein
MTLFVWYLLPPERIAEEMLEYYYGQYAYWLGVAQIPQRLLAIQQQ